jgi:hypothetical protein
MIPPGSAETCPAFILTTDCTDYTDYTDKGIGIFDPC